MSQSPLEVQLAATDVTSSVTDDGMVRVVGGFEGFVFQKSWCLGEGHHVTNIRVTWFPNKLCS
jgi:hypothetical protein